MASSTRRPRRWTRETQVLALEVADREAILRVLEDGPPEFAELRAVQRIRNDLAELSDMLERFVGLEAEHEMAGYYKAERPDAQAEIEREILSRADTLRRKLES